MGNLHIICKILIEDGSTVVWTYLANGYNCKRMSYYYLYLLK